MTDKWVWRAWRGKIMIAQGEESKFWNAILAVDAYRQEYSQAITFTIWDPAGEVVWPVNQVKGAGPRKPLET